MDALGINLGYLLMQILLFVILMLVMRNYAYAPVLRTLEERKARISKGLEDARQAAIARDNADTEAKKILDAARAEAAKIRSDAAVQAEESALAIRANADREAKGIVASGREEAEAERNRVLADLRGQVVAIAIAAAHKLVGETLDEKRQHALISEFFARVPAGVASATASTAEVTSALPLTEAEKSNVQAVMKAGTVNFKVDPTILGGLIVRVGDQVVDNSIANQMNALRNSLN